MIEVIYIDPNDLNQFKNAIQSFENNKKIKSFLMLMAANDMYDSFDIETILSEISKPVIGGVFPEIIFKGKRIDQGLILVPLEFELQTQLFNLNDDFNEYTDRLKSIQVSCINQSSSLFVFTDALNPNKDEFIEILFNYFGINPTYIGGGAGSLSFKSFKCIINNQGMHANAAVIGWACKKISLGVAHGWQSISQPLKVTKVRNNIISSINWQPAFEVYKGVVELHSGQKFTSNNFFEIAKSYPLGITKIDAEMVVRDPFMVEGNNIHLIDAIKEGEYVNILHGNLNSLLDGATKARNIAISKADALQNANVAFCIDCISRVLFMQDDFKKELDAIGDKHEVNGILTIGEIANSEESYLEIYNKTIVVGIW